MAKSFSSNWMKAVARDAARASRELETNRKRLLKAQEAQRKAAERQRKQAEIAARRRVAQTEKERKQLEKEANQQYVAVEPKKLKRRTKQMPIIS